jgi:hypothetical protein
MILMIADSLNVRNLATVALLAVSLGGCTTAGGSPDDMTSRLMIAPGKYTLYNCQQLAERSVVITTRQKELQGLMAKAETAADGRVVSAIAYRPEYVALRADMNELRNATAARDCKALPAAQHPAGRKSDSIIR